MQWHSRLFLYVCLPMLLLAGISYALIQVTAPDTAGEKTKQAKPDDTKGPDKGPDKEPAPEPPPVPADWPWLPLATAAIGGATGLISAIAALLRAIVALRRRRKS